jgi:aminopeptidase N
MSFIRNIFIIALISLFSIQVFAGSGGPLSREQAAYDVKYYELDLEIIPPAKLLKGSLLCTAEITDTLSLLVMDLDYRFTVDSILLKIGIDEFSTAAFTHSAGKINIFFPDVAAVGEMVSVKIFYFGTPKQSVSPPWDAGFVWSTTPSGKPWIGVACEDEGADIWWPCKDHPTDEPDSMYMRFTVPNPLMCISNGRFMGSIDNGNNTSTYNWFVSTPINNYNVTVYIAEYSLIEDDYFSISGETIPFYFWVLPERYNQAVNYMGVFLNEFNYLESICGPFPFGTDKHGWAHSPYWGMEHQTIIAYGHNFTLNSWGFDYIHYHELAHEWWGNLITAKDWADVWIHEGIATYTEALYVEHMRGKNDYHLYMNSNRPPDNHARPLAPRESLTAGEGFGLNPYRRGASVMHTLRYHLGDTSFFNLLKRWAYPDSTDFDNTNGRLCRILSTEDMKEQAEAVTGLNLYPFFEVFFREKSYPQLMVTRGDDGAIFTWKTEANVPLDLNIPVRINGVDQTIEMNNGSGTAPILKTDILVIDPLKWILMAPPSVVTSMNDEDNKKFDYHLGRNYPNPFNPSTTISFSIPENQYVELKVYDLLGNVVAELVNENKQRGTHSIDFNAGVLSSGTYFYELKAEDFRKVQKMQIIK